MRHLDKLILRILNPTRISNEDVLDTVKQYWDDVTEGYWTDVDDELAEELGVTPVALSELLEVHRHTFTYANIGGISSVRGYDHGDDWIVVMFSDGTRYLYTTKSTTPESIGYMKELAHAGKGLNSYIMRLQRMNYAGRNVKGEILIKPGMEQYNPDGYKRIQLVVAFINTLSKQTISNEELMHNTLKQYQTQIESAGRDGLDPTACQLMQVGLESMGCDVKVSLENHEEDVSKTASLSKIIDTHLKDNVDEVAG